VIVLVAPGGRSISVNGFVLGLKAGNVMIGALTVNTTVTSAGNVAVPVVPPPCEAVMCAVPTPTKCTVPLTIVATPCSANGMV